MAIQTFTDLKTAISNWMARGDLTGDAEDFIALGEAGLNRELPAVEIDQSLSGATGSREIDISSLAMVEPVALFISGAGLFDELELTPQAPGTYPISDTSGLPKFWSIDGDNIVFDRPLDQNYTFRFRFRQKFALSDSAPTNWLLTNHPDLYLAAVLVWGGIFIRGDYLNTYKAVLDTTLPTVKRNIAQKKRGLLTVDPGLQSIGRRFDGWWYFA